MPRVSLIRKDPPGLKGKLRNTKKKIRSPSYTGKSHTWARLGLDTRQRIRKQVSDSAWSRPSWFYMGRTRVSNRSILTVTRFSWPYGRGVCSWGDTEVWNLIFDLVVAQNSSMSFSYIFLDPCFWRTCTLLAAMALPIFSALKSVWSIVCRCWMHTLARGTHTHFRELVGACPYV